MKVHVSCSVSWLSLVMSTLTRHDRKARPPVICTNSGDLLGLRHTGVSDAISNLILAVHYRTIPPTLSHAVVPVVDFSLVSYSEI